MDAKGEGVWVVYSEYGGGIHKVTPYEAEAYRFHYEHPELYQNGDCKVEFFPFQPHREVGLSEDERVELALLRTEFEAAKVVLAELVSQKAVLSFSNAEAALATAHDGVIAYYQRGC